MVTCFNSHLEVFWTVFNSCFECNSRVLHCNTVTRCLWLTLGCRLFFLGVSLVFAMMSHENLNVIPKTDLKVFEKCLNGMFSGFFMDVLFVLHRCLKGVLKISNTF